MGKRPETEAWKRTCARTASASRRVHARGSDVLLFAILIQAIAFIACAGTTSRSGSNPPPPLVTVTVQPASATLFLGQTQQFQASVGGITNTGVSWAVNGTAGGSSTLGTISATGLYTAPAVLPTSTTLSISATSAADSNASGSATITLEDDIVIGISPPSVTIAAGTSQVFTASVTASGSPALGVAWSVNGIAGGNGTVGTIAANGAGSAMYTAPIAPPSPPSVTITATSVADATKSGSASATITCGNLISPASATVLLGQTQMLTATVCAASGTQVIWDVNGIVGGSASVGTIAASSSGGANVATYTAPVDLPSTNPVTVHATAGTLTASAIITITSGISVTVSPPYATVLASQRATFTAIVSNAADAAVTWTINGIANGDATAGEICVVSSNPCVSPSGAVSGSVDYLAPAAPPSVNPVMIVATSRADPSQSGMASAFVAAQTGPISVSVSPAYAFAVPSGSQPSTMQFFASVSGTNLTSVTWGVRSGVAGQGCAGAACGTVDARGVYTAPVAAPSPNAISVIATSVFDTTKSGSASVAITSGPTIRALLPSSVMAGAVESFPLQVQGVNFVAGNSGSGSTILLNGQARSTTCATAGACATALNPSDVQSAATITVQIRNPGTPGALSNAVPFVIIPFDVSVGTISLGLLQPAASGQNIIVTEPTTAAASAPISVDFVGFLSGTTCGVQGSPLTVTRPSSGSAVVSLCVHGNGLDPTFSYAFTGPNGSADIGVLPSGISGIFPNMIELDLTISSAALPGVRSLMITTLNNDRAVASGMLEVK